MMPCVLRGIFIWDDENANCSQPCVISMNCFAYCFPVDPSLASLEDGSILSQIFERILLQVSIAHPFLSSPPPYSFLFYLPNYLSLISSISGILPLKLQSLWFLQVTEISSQHNQVMFGSLPDIFYDMDRNFLQVICQKSKVSYFPSLMRFSQVIHDHRPMLPTFNI